MSAADGSDVSGGPVTTSHFEGQLTGLARHPHRAEFVTAGGDGTVGYFIDSSPLLMLLSDFILWLVLDGHLVTETAREKLVLYGQSDIILHKSPV